MIADLFSNDGSVISHSINLLSGMSSAFMAMMVCWITIILGRIMLKDGREEMPTDTETLALGFAGAVGGLTAQVFGFQQLRVRYILCLPFLLL